MLKKLKELFGFPTEQEKAAAKEEVKVEPTPSENVFQFPKSDKQETTEVKTKAKRSPKVKTEAAAKTPAKKPAAKKTTAAKKPAAPKKPRQTKAV